MVKSQQRKKKKHLKVVNHQDDVFNMKFLNELWIARIHVCLPSQYQAAIRLYMILPTQLDMQRLTECPSGSSSISGTLHSYC